jgi:hypothetical protein
MNHSNGTFVAVRFSEETISTLGYMAQFYSVPNPIDLSELHSTVVYSRKPLKNVPPQRELLSPWIAKPIGFDVFETRNDMYGTGSPTRCLVLKIDCPEMHARHNFLRKWEGASHDFPSYQPHITLSYDIGDYDIRRLDAMTILPEILIVQEYSQELKDHDRRKESRQEES